MQGQGDLAPSSSASAASLSTITLTGTTSSRIQNLPRVPNNPVVPPSFSGVQYAHLPPPTATALGKRKRNGPKHDVDADEHEQQSSGIPELKAQSPGVIEEQPTTCVAAAAACAPTASPGSSSTTAMPQTPYQSKVKLQQKYQILGFISSGTYGRVFKARSRDPNNHGEFAIKKFKPDKEGEVMYTGISQSAIREMALCSELHHENVIHLVEIILEDKCIYMIFEYAEHDLLQIIHFHSHPERRNLPESTIKSVLWQLLNGVSYLHQNWVLHRDLKPANIMVTASGEVKIGDLGLARLFWKPLQSLFTGDKVVVTIWYRAPELLLGSRHYTPAIDLWAVGCIFAELLALRPIFKGEEAKMDNKKNVPFQRNQMMKIIEILGTPTKERWPGVIQQPEYAQLAGVKHYQPQLDTWYHQIGATNSLGFQLLSGLLEYDPTKRLTAQQALEHKFFTEGVKLSLNAFEGTGFEYPHRRVTQEDDISQPGTKRTGLQDDTMGAQRKRLKGAE